MGATPPAVPHPRKRAGLLAEPLWIPAHPTTRRSWSRGSFGGENLGSRSAELAGPDEPSEYRRGYSPWLLGDAYLPVSVEGRVKAAVSLSTSYFHPPSVIS